MARGGRKTSNSDQGPYEYHLLEDMASTPPLDSEKKKVSDDTNSDDEVLAQLGYTQGIAFFFLIWLVASISSDSCQNSSVVSACWEWWGSRSASSLHGLLFRVFS